MTPKKIILAASFLSIGLGLAAAPASAADCVFSTPAVADPSCTTEVKPVPLNPTTPSTPAVSSPTAARPTATAQLPVTGVETAVLVSTGALLVAGGSVLVARTRRTAPVAS